MDYLIWFSQVGTIIISIFRCGNWYFKNLCYLLKITELIDNDTRIQTQSSDCRVWETDGLGVWG